MLAFTSQVAQKKTLEKLTELGKRMQLQEVGQKETGANSNARSLQDADKGTMTKRTLRLPDDMCHHEEFRGSKSVVVSKDYVMLNQHRMILVEVVSQEMKMKRTGVQNFLFQGEKAETYSRVIYLIPCKKTIQQNNTKYCSHGMSPNRNKENSGRRRTEKNIEIVRNILENNPNSTQICIEIYDRHAE